MLYSRLLVSACAAFLAVIPFHAIGFSGTLWAQDERPLVVPLERKVPAKKDNGPRAIGVLRLSADGKTSLQPIAILINGKFWDATVYKADPTPMALDSGTVYEVERDGRSLGLFTVSGALHSNAPNADSPWIATGSWVPAGSDVGKPALKADIAPVGLDANDQPPRLTKKPSASPSSSQAPPDSTTPPPPASSKTSPSTSDDGPPRLTKPAPSTSAPPADPSQSGTASSPSSSSSSSPSETKPADTKSGDAKPEAKPSDSNPASPPVPVSDSGAGESARPRLRRGKPTGPPPDEDIPGYSRFDAAAGPSGAKTLDVKATAAKTAAASNNVAVETIPAISDAGGPEPHSFAFAWLKDEEDDRRKQMIALAKQQLRAYLDAQAKAITKAAATTARTASRSANTKAKQPDPILDNVHMVAYDLWLSNQPVLVFSAEAHFPPPPRSAANSATQSEMVYPILLVAYPDIYNNLHQLYSGVTDRFHLDLRPRLELVDALDADGDGFGELLFRETSDAGTGWVIYRATADKLWKMYDSLNPE